MAVGRNASCIPLILAVEIWSFPGGALTIHLLLIEQSQVIQPIKWNYSDMCVWHGFSLLDTTNALYQ